MRIEKRLDELGIALPTAPQRGGLYTPIKAFCQGKLVYASGFGSTMLAYHAAGRLGDGISIEEGQRAAANCILNMLAAFKRDYGDLDRIRSFVKLLALVSSENTFYDQPKVADGATSLLVNIFGEEAGLPARSAIGVNVLPGNIPVEIEALIEIE